MQWFRSSDACLFMILAGALFTLGCDVQAPSKNPVRGGSSASFGVEGIVEYTVQDSRGRVLEHGVVHNTVNSDALDETFSRLIEGAAGAIAGYDAIAALSVPNGTDDPSDGVDATSITLLLDGNDGSSGDHNPADGTVSSPSDGSGQGTVSVTFTAQGAAEVKQIVLTKADENDTTVGLGAAAIADANILSYLDVPDVSLNNTDSVTYIWTINID